MGWVRIDDSFYDHPRFHNVSALGVAAFVTGLAYCNRNLTDGLIPYKTARVLIDTDRYGETIEPIDGVVECAEAGLFIKTDAGYQIRDYLDYQPSAEQIKAGRAKNAARKAAWRASHGVSPDGTDSVSPVSSHSDSPAVSPLPVTAPPNPNPNPNPKNPRGARATDPPDFMPLTDDMKRWAAENRPDLDPALELDKMLDWHRGNGKKKTNWVATWKNWMRNAKSAALPEYSEQRQRRSDADRMWG